MRLCGRINSLTERNQCLQPTHPRFTMTNQHFPMHSNLLHPFPPPLHRDADESSDFDESNVVFSPYTRPRFQYLPSSVDPGPCWPSANSSVSYEQSWLPFIPYDSPSPSPLSLPSDVGLGPSAQFDSVTLSAIIGEQDAYFSSPVIPCGPPFLMHPTQVSLAGVQLEQDMVYHPSLSSPHYMDGQFRSPDTHITPSMLLSDDFAPSISSNASHDQEWPCPHCDGTSIAAHSTCSWADSSPWQS